ncbi:MAG: DUF1592 domain-containing protein [Myxococcota bacterium]
MVRRGLSFSRVVVGYGALVSICGLSIYGCTGSFDSGGTPPGTVPLERMPVEDPTALQCTISEADRRSVGDLRRLSHDEYLNTLRALLPAAALEPARPVLALFPDDPTAISPGEFDPSHGREHVDSIFRTSTEVAETIVADPALLGQIAPDCLADPSNAEAPCVREWIGEFGRRVVRRPLTDDEIDSYFALYQTDDEGFTDDAQRIELVLAALLNAPELVFHVTSTEGDAPRVVDEYTLASRLSYRTQGGPPDDALLQAAETGSLADPAELRTQAERLLDSEEGRNFVRQLFSRWLALDDRPEPDRVAIESAGVSRDGIREEFREEALAYVEHVIFDRRGSFTDLMTDDAVFPGTERLATILDAEQSDGPVSGPSPRGLLGRPALLTSPYPRTNIITRGTFVTRRMLCRELEPPPGVDTVADALLEGRDLTEMTAREIATVSTEPPACAECHDQLNPPGFALESFGPLGQFRRQEDVYTNEGEFVRSLEIRDEADLILDEASSEVQGIEGLGSAIAVSEEATSCAAVQVFRATHLREPRASDACHIDALRAAVREERSLFDVLVENVIAEARAVGGVN